VFVAALVHAFGPNDERGIFRTGDGGKSWQRVLFPTATAAGSMSFSIRAPEYAIRFAVADAARAVGISPAAGRDRGFIDRATGAFTWKLLEHHGLPAGPLGRIGVSVSGADSNRVYCRRRGEGGRGVPFR